MLDKVKEIAVLAGKQIMTVYKKDFQIDYKDDESPLTTADHLSHELIQNELNKRWPHIPVLSEEGSAIPIQERASWELFWLIDPLDGTKEFIKRNDEFTVNIALIRNGKPVLGVIYAPALDLLYFGKEKDGAYKQSAASKCISDPVRLYADRLGSQKKVVVSRSHMSKDTRAYLKELEKKEGDLQFISIGSSLKFCLVAEGSAHYYPRLAPTMEWDTGAGQCIAEEAGCLVFQYQTSAPLIYNKEVLTNPWFICSI
ncbi:3'(2'),5'-bisphosphate nucleotidase CysQ [Rossellomorea oryzaecorticis]|jgi:3'(2'), 5'-bisphosphate nucleotidase|uniref:3'(2'),5'-bisphosphate nucleotidase CysQ n=1 Tax=Rossellomorea oryzaecorticis TaxID=1396505 RepID=A0ABW8VKM8_9BACI|nr:3'(2'),5'-bisphosphate nucleotidase CysQ [[Bacillus] enclensis]MBH9965383.1 3'(2'),5'-bisphosphate nucleotidase CysQ [[Bacillus] enclensis]QWC24569.1 3'(2'),5'-bisphosphate nucleotidase CysQ [Bacillus haikouensis]